VRLLLEETRTPVGKMFVLTDDAGALCVMDFEEFERKRLLLAHEANAQVGDGRYAVSSAAAVRSRSTKTERTLACSARVSP
jgi:hypothetical protein